MEFIVLFQTTIILRENKILKLTVIIIEILKPRVISKHTHIRRLFFRYRCKTYSPWIRIM